MGLEYTRAYLADMLAGVIPSRFRRGCVPTPEAKCPQWNRGRLYYVGMTRAKEQLRRIYLDRESDLCFFRRSV